MSGLVNTDPDLVCWACGHVLLDLPLPVGRLNACPACKKDLHVCKMCKSYQPRLANACEAVVDDSPQDKTRANFCEWFEVKLSAHQVQQRNVAQQAALAELFGLQAVDTKAVNPFGDHSLPSKSVKNPFED